MCWNQGRAKHPGLLAHSKEEKEKKRVELPQLMKNQWKELEEMPGRFTSFLGGQQENPAEVKQSSMWTLSGVRAVEGLQALEIIREENQQLYNAWNREQKSVNKGREKAASQQEYVAFFRNIEINREEKEVFFRINTTPPSHSWGSLGKWVKYRQSWARIWLAEFNNGMIHDTGRLHLGS